MSWLYSQALVEEYSAATCLDGEQSAPLNGNPTQLAYLPPDRMTAFSRLSRFGMTFKPLTEDLGQGVLMSFLEAFPAKTFQQQDEAKESTEPDLGCGHTWQELLARYDPASSSWKTPQSSLLEDSTEFSGTWPRWGSMQDGVSYQRQTLVRHIKETGFGLWATPSASDGQRGGTITDKMTGRSLTQMVNTPSKWPTPQASDNRQRATANSTARRMELGKQISLEAAVKFWPTPTAHNAKEGAYPAEFTRNIPTLSAQAGGTLNPTWVEWLMGWPLGWTDLKPLGMDKYQQWRQQHGGS